jgi:hypothetical protein
MRKNDKLKNDWWGFYFHSLNRICSGTTEIERSICESDTSGTIGRGFTIIILMSVHLKLHFRDFITLCSKSCNTLVVWASKNFNSVFGTPLKDILGSGQWIKHPFSYGPPFSHQKCLVTEWRAYMSSMLFCLIHMGMEEFWYPSSIKVTDMLILHSSAVSRFLLLYLHLHGTSLTVIVLSGSRFNIGPFHLHCMYPEALFLLSTESSRFLYCHKMVGFCLDHGSFSLSFGCPWN